MGEKRSLGALQAISLAVLLLVVLGCVQACYAYNPGDPEFRGFWIDAWGAGALNQSQVNTLLGTVGTSQGGQIRDAKCNAVVVQVRRNCDANYPSSMGEPYMSGLSPSNFNSLQAVINAAHDTTGGKQRIEVHAWMVTFRTSGGAVYSRHDDTPTGSLTTLDNYWPSRDNTGAEVSDKAFDPGHPLVEDYTVNVAMDIVNNFDVDGVHFDYIRFTANNQGYNPTSVARYNARYGLTGSPSATNEQWKQWRRDQVSAVVRKVYAKVQASKPWVKVSGSFVTWNPSPKTSTRDGFKATRPYYDVYCDWDSMLQEGIVDMAVPMTYYNYASLPGDWTRWMNWEKDRHGNRHMVVGPGIYLNSLSNSILELQQTRDQSPAHNNAQGWCGYSYRVPYVSGTWSGFSPSLLSGVTGSGTAPIPTMPWKATPTKGHISGTVTVKTTGKWADGATVTVTGPETRTMLTDGTGFYAFIDLTPGTYTVTASLAGLPTSTKVVNVQIGAVTGNMYVTDFSLGGPIMSGIQTTQLTTGTQQVTWTTDVPSTSQVEYGLTSSYGMITTLDTSMVTSHSVVVSGLQPKTLYHFRVISSDDDGRTLSNDMTFTSIGPPEISGVGYTALTNYGATIIWNTDQPATTQVEYGPTTSYGQTTTLDSSLVTSHSQAIISLPILSTYHYRVISTNVNGTTMSGDYTFKTSGPPIISNVASAPVYSNSATITWTTNAPSDSKVSYGTTTSYGSTKSDSNYVYDHSLTITGLTPLTTYHFKCTSANPYDTTNTADFNFTTIAAPAVTGVTVSNITASSATISWTSDQLTDTSVVYGYVANTYPLQQSDSTATTSHTITLTGLTSATAYRFKAQSSNVTGTGSSSEMTFTTLVGVHDYIVDNSDTSGSPAPFASTGTWSSGSANGSYNSGFKYVKNQASTPTVTCTWTPTLIEGNYDIYVYYPNYTTTRTTNATYKVHANGADTNVYCNQSINPSQWNLVATGVPCLAGTSAYLRLSNLTGETSATTNVCADAVKFVWTGITGPPAISSVVATPTSTSCVVTWNTDQNSTSGVDYGLESGYGTSLNDTTEVPVHSMTIDGLLPNTTYHFRVRSSNMHGNSASDDYTFRTSPVDYIVDNRDAGATYTGSWSEGSYPGAYPDPNHYNTYRVGTPTGGGMFTWTPSLPLAGLYDVYCWYNNGSNRSVAARYTIATPGGPLDVFVNQTQKDPTWNGAAGGWVLLASGVQLADGAGAAVTLDSNVESGKVVIADAIRWRTAGIVDDTTRPTVAVGSPSASITKNGPVTYLVTYGDNFAVTAVTLTAANITLNKTGTADGTISVSGSGTTNRLVTISNITGSGTLSISITSGTATDAAGNLAVSTGASAAFTADNTPPAIAVSAPSTSLTATGPVTYTVTYTGASSVTLSSANITAEKVGTADGTVTVTGSGNTTRTVTVNGITGDGEISFSIAPGTAVDSVGNAALATDSSAAFSVDNSTVPAVTIGEPSAPSTTGDPITYVISYDSASAVTLTAANITLNKTGTANGNVTVTGDGTTNRTVTIDSITGTGTLGISIAAGTAVAANGAMAPAAGPSTTFSVDYSVPVTVAIGAPSATATSAGPVSYTVTYTGATSITLSPADITLSKTGTADGIVAVTGSGTTTRTVTISSVTGSGTLGISIAAGTAGTSTPAAGPSATFVVDNTAPVVSCVNDETYTTSTTSLSGSWCANDLESGISKYEYAVGTNRTSALTDVRGWTDAGTATSASILGLSLQTGHTYYISVRATNGAGLTSAPMTSTGVAVAYSVSTVKDAKALPLNAPIELWTTSNFVISAKFPMCFYIEDHNRLGGVRVQYDGTFPFHANQMVMVTGTVGLTDDGERAILNPQLSYTADGAAILPLALSTKTIGGGDLGFTPGVTGGTGLNNTGLLVKIAGHVTKGVADGFYLSDGFNTTDETGYAGVKVWTGISGVSHEGNNVLITGVVSCRKVGDTVYPIILARDIVVK